VRSLFLSVIVCGALCMPALAQTSPCTTGLYRIGSPDIVSSLVAQSFKNAYGFKSDGITPNNSTPGTFGYLVAPLLNNSTEPDCDAITNVSTLGSAGLIQEFQGRGGTGTYVLIDPDPSGANITFQMFADIYTFYRTFSQSTIGYPTISTTTCPANSFGSCDYQLFTSNIALFAFSSPSVNVSIVSPYNTEWNANGGLNGPLGVPSAAPAAVASVSKLTGNQQLFAGGAILTYTPTGTTTAVTFTVYGAIYTAWTSAGGYASMGFPTSEAVVQGSGVYQQTFERGTIQWTPGSPAVVVLPLAQISIAGAGQGLSLNIGATATLSATTVDTQGNIATGRAVSWSTSNGNVVKVLGNGNTATITAVGAGTANIYATAGGVTSQPFPVSVAGVCCGVGQGAPTATITQAFQTAAARNQLSLALPNPTTVIRAGNGYIQTLTASGSGAVYVIAEADNSPIAYVIGGALYTAYLAAGGFAGPLGYPASDASAGGTQSFKSGVVLAGSPVHLVPAAVSAKWLSLGAETGILGPVTADAATFASLTGEQGYSQAFTNGTIFGMTSGPHAGQAYYSTGLILNRYIALSGPASALGPPIADPVVNAGVQSQNFEAGYIDLQPGATFAVEHYNPRTPAANVTPAALPPGGTVHISLTGFALGATLAVTESGKAPFTVTAPAGEFSWNEIVPAAAKAATVSLQVKAAGSTDTAATSYSITTLPQLQPRLTVVSGNQQTGLPGATLAAPLVARLTDINGNPLSGVPVALNVSPGASVRASAQTDANGLISATLRLPASPGVALLSVSASSQVASFSALAAAGTIQGVPAYTQTTPQGSRTAALAALIRYYQNAGALGSPNGLATAAALGQYLSSNKGTALSDTGAAIPNPWAALQFAGLPGGVVSLPATLNSVLDSLAAGSPLVLDLSLTIDGAPAGTTTVNAIGSNPDGSVALLDPNPVFARASLADYLNGFPAAGHTIQGTLSAVLAIVPAAATPNGFVIAAPLSAKATAASASGSCTALNLGDPAIAGQPAPASMGGVTYLACDGTAPAYQAGLAGTSGAAIYDLAGGPPASIPPSGSAAWQITRAASGLAVAAQQIFISSIVNSATLAPGLSPGEIFTIFGTGLAAGSTLPSVTVGTRPATVLAAFPYQINAVMPAAIPAGNTTVQVAGALGTVSQNATVAALSPGIYVIGTTADGRPLGAILNQDNTLNTAANPIDRGNTISIYGAGLGPTTTQKSLQVTTATVTVVLDGGTPLPTAFAGLTPGIAGLYQVNFQVPAATAPGVYHNVAVQAAGQLSNTVALAVQ